MTAAHIEQSLSARIVAAVAEREDTDETALPPLYDVLDPDALDKLFSSGSDGTPTHIDSLRFHYADHELIVQGDGTFEVL